MHGSARHRMTEIELRGVKSHSANRIRTAAVHFVADDGVTAFGKVDTDLVFASCLQPDLDERRPGPGFDDVDVSDGEFTCTRSVRGIDPECGIFREMGTDRKIVWSDSALDDSNVSASRRVILELILKSFLGLNRFRENQKAGCLAVQPMHDEDFSRRPFPVRSLPQGGINGSRSFRIRCHREEPGGLIDNDKAFVFEHDPDPIKQHG